MDSRASGMIDCLHTQPADLRERADDLCGIICGQFQGDPQDGSLFLFFNRRRDRLKMLHWDGNGD